jgi:SAM-dependent methyltransferase
MTITEFLMEKPLVYRLWQGTHESQKWDQIAKHSDLRSVRRVLDVGCGPGTNTPIFKDADYTGIDINPDYISYARKKYGRNHVVADVTQYRVPVSEKFDFILVNSFLHHIDTPSVRSILSHLRELLAPGGFVHMVEVVIPNEKSLPRLMAQLDRGKYVRPLKEWQTLFEESLVPEVFEPFPVTLMGLRSWIMVYCKAGLK